MTRSIFKTRQIRRMAAICLFALSVLFLVSSSRPWAIAQAVWRVEIKEGETASSSLSINNHCAAPHSFRVTNKFKSLRFEEPTDSLLIEASGSKRIAASFDAHGLKSKLYGGKVDIECLDCKKEQGCSQDHDELAVEMNVIKSVKPAGNGTEKPGSANASQGNPQLTLNKAHVKNANDAVSPPASTTWQPGVPITYVISLSNSGAPNSNISVADTPPPGFVFVSATCTASFGATCPGGTLAPPTFGAFNIPTGGNVEVRMTGYFTTGGAKINTATATAKDPQGNVLSVGTANSSTDQLTVSSAQPSVNIAVSKSGTPTTATFPATLHYTITVANTTATDVFLGGNARIVDQLNPLSTIALGWTISTPTCLALGGAVCPDISTPAANSSSILFQYDATGGPTANDNGWLPGNSSYTLKFDVVVTTTANCGDPSVTFRNRAYLDFLNGFSDANFGDNVTPWVNTTINTGLSACAPTGPAIAKVQCTTTTGACTPGTTANWNAPVRYQIKIGNPTGAALASIPLSDGIFKITGTPTFTATVAVGDPHCVSGCSGTTTFTPTTTPPPTVNADSTLFPLWAATLSNLSPTPPAAQAVIEYTVVYVPVCETSAQPDSIVNRIVSGSTWSDATTNITPETSACNLTVDKQKVTPGPIVFEQPTTYNVVFANPSAASLAVTVRDALSISSSQYGNFTFTYSTSCAATGIITPVPAAQTNVLSTVSYSGSPWQGLALINAHPTFGPGSTLTCQVTVTAHKPPDTSPFCQGAGNPQLVNAAYMDLSTNYNPSAQPTLYQAVAADLPLCRSVIVTKIATPHTYGPGAPITYTITVENKGKDPVASFVLKDAVPLPLIPVSVSGCTPSTACTTGPTLNTTTGQVDVAYGLLQPSVPVSFTLTVTAPQAGGSDSNLAVGSFLPGGNFYFQGDENQFLQQEENIQVLTPTLAKVFNPGQIAPNGTSTLTFNVTNTNSDPKQTGINFADTLPPGLQIVSVMSNGCSGNATISTDGHTVTLSGGQLVGPNADGSGKHTCQISVQVKASSECGINPNTKANFSEVKNLDVSNINEHLDVVGCSTKPPSMDKDYKPAKIPVNGTTNLAFTITNSSGDPKQTGINFSDKLPSGLQIVSVGSSGCGGTVTISSDHQTVTLTGGQLVGSNTDGSGKHSCQIIVKVKASDHCGVYPNNEKNFSDVKNLDISGINAPLTVDCAGDGGGLTVQKDVKGAPAGFHGQFNFLVQCSTPNGFYQKAVTVNWPTPGFITLNDVPAGSQCVVTEGPPPGSLPANYNWDGLPAYSANGGVVSIDPKGHVTVTDTMSLCNQTGQVTITKVVKGLPKNYIGVFQGTLSCWVSNNLITYPVTLTSPNGLTTTIGNIPLGSACTFQETGQPPLTGGLVWNQPVYSPDFGTVTLTGECCQQITVTNEAHPCCTGQPGGPGSGTGQSYSDPGPAQPPTNYGKPTKPAPRGRRNIRKTSP